MTLQSFTDIIEIIAGILLIAGAAWGVWKWLHRDKSAGKTQQIQKEKLPPVEIPEWIEKGFPSIAELMNTFPEYCIDDKRTYNEFIRRINAAHLIHAYQKYTEQAFGRGGKSTTIGGTVSNVYDGLQARNYAYARLEARTCFKRRWWE